MSGVDKKRMTLALVTVIAGAGLLVVLQSKPAETIIDLPENSTYASYIYGETNTIYVGTQPLYSPTGLLTETMQRDLILKEELLKLGLKIIFYPFMKGADVNAQLIPGHLQAGIAGDMPTLRAAATTNMVIPMMVQSDLTWLVTRPRVLLKDLKGKRIAYANGSNAHFMLLILLSSKELSVDDVELVPMDVAHMIDALKNRDISAFAAWEPTPTIAREKHGFVTRFGGPSTGYMSFRRDFADQRPAALRQMVASVARAGRWLRDGSAENRVTASVWAIEQAEMLTGAKFPLLPQEFAAIGFRGVQGAAGVGSFAIPPASLSRKGRLRKEYTFLEAIGAFPKESRWEDLQASFDTTILSGVLGRPREYRLSEFRYTPAPITPGKLDAAVQKEETP